MKIENEENSKKADYWTNEMANRDIRAKNFPFLYEDGPRAVMGVK